MEYEDKCDMWYAFINACVYHGGSPHVYVSYQNKKVQGYLRHNNSFLVLESNIPTDLGVAFRIPFSGLIACNLTRSRPVFVRITTDRLYLSQRKDDFDYICSLPIVRTPFPGPTVRPVVERRCPYAKVYQAAIDWIYKQVDSVCVHFDKTNITLSGYRIGVEATTVSIRCDCRGTPFGAIIPQGRANLAIRGLGGIKEGPFNIGYNKDQRLVVFERSASNLQLTYFIKEI